jgi:hypothetical protein
MLLPGSEANLINKFLKFQKILKNAQKKTLSKSAQININLKMINIRGITGFKRKI